jgi:hypothetical protein
MFQCTVYEFGDELSNCTDCLSACQSTVYDFDLSATSLAYTAFSTLEEATQKSIRKNYKQAMSLQQRVKKTNLMEILGGIQGVLDTIDEFEFQAKFYFLDSKTSLIKLAEMDVTELKQLVIEDATNVYAENSDFEEIYKEYLGPFVDIFALICDKVSEDFSGAFVLNQLLAEKINSPVDLESEYENVWFDSVQPILALYEDGLRQLNDILEVVNLNAFDRLVEIVDTTPFEIVDYDETLLPRFLTSPRERVLACQEVVENDNLAITLDEPVRRFHEILESFYPLTPGARYIEDVFPENFTDFQTSFVLYERRTEIRQDIVTLNNISSVTKECMQKYGVSLAKYKKRVDEISLSDVVVSNVLFETEELAGIRESKRKLKTLFDDFAGNTKSVYDIKEEIVEIGEFVEEARSTLYNSIQLKMVEPLTAALKTLETEIISTYTTSTEDMIEMMGFMTDTASKFTEKVATEQIWREPTPDLSGEGAVQFLLSNESGEAVVGRSVQVFWETLGGKDIINSTKYPSMSLFSQQGQLSCQQL